MTQTPQKKVYLDKTFHLMFSVLVIFGLPAVVAVVLGKWLDKAHETGKVITLGLLASAFVVSWTIMIRKYLALEKERLARESAPTH